MILITGASGKTGQAIVKLLKDGGEPVRAMVHRVEQVAVLQNAGASDVFVGNLQSEADLETACQGIRALYHICPNMHPQEVEIARIALSAAVSKGVERFIYHSVLHPQVEAMAHHWNKLRVEELIFTSRIPYTILQPCAYMQNVLGSWSRIVSDGVVPVPYSVEAALSMVDLEDVAQVAVKALIEPGYEAACYELCGPESLTQTAVADILSRELGRPVRAVEIARSEWEKQARTSGLNDYARQTLLKMFEYYGQFGLVGNPSILACLLKRQPNSFSDFIRRTIGAKKASTISKE